MQPGETITPGTSPASERKTPAPELPKAPEPTTPTAGSPAPSAPQSATPQPVANNGESISWTASEYLIHHKSFGWFLWLGFITLALAIVVWFITGDVMSVIVVGVVGLIFGVAAAKPPRVLGYSLDEEGLHMGDKTYSYEEFKSFSVLDEGQLSSISLMPMKRFMPGVSIYYPPEQEEDIANVLALYLPHEERKPDLVDRLMHKVRF